MLSKQREKRRLILSTEKIVLPLIDAGLHVPLFLGYVDPLLYSLGRVVAEPELGEFPLAILGIKPSRLIL